MRFESYKLILAIAAFAAATMLNMSAAKADLIYSYAASQNLSDPNTALNAKAMITLDGNDVSVQLTNLDVNQRSSGQAISGIQIFFKNDVGVVSGFDETGQLIKIAANA